MESYGRIVNGRYEGGRTDNGWCYKSAEAWETGVGIIYICEAAINEGEADGWTKKEWLDYTKDAVRQSCESNIWTDDGFIEYIARNILENAEWEDLSTRLTEWIYCLERSLEDEYEYYKTNQNYGTSNNSMLWSAQRMAE